MKEVTLPSGAKLVVNLAPFEDSKNLFQAINEELKQVQMNTGTELGALIKDIFCAGIASKKIEACAWKCMIRCTYDGAKVEPSVFEPEEARVDFMPVLFEVIEENVKPFTSALTQKFSQLSEVIAKVQK